MLPSKAARRILASHGSRVSKFQVRTMYGFMHNESRLNSMIFKPQYTEHGTNLNHDPVWFWRPTPPCTITGKPRRQLGHFPAMGRPIVPFHRLDYKATFDNERTPMPWFEEPRCGSNLRQINWMIIKQLTFILVMWFLYLTKHFFRECDELYKQNHAKELPFPSPVFYPNPRYYYRPNNPNPEWISNTNEKQLEQEMVWFKMKTVNNTGVWCNMWLEPLQYDRDGNLSSTAMGKAYKY